MDVHFVLSPLPRKEYLRDTVLASYPRSGNSLFRRLLEEATGIITGSDTRPDRTLSRTLSVFGMQGEGVVDDRVRVVKTHFPERSGYKRFEANKAFLLVRNPFDAIDSYFNMALTNTHDKSLHDAVYLEFADFLDGMIRNEIKVWQRFHQFWLSQGIALHVLRYEDLLSRPAESLQDAIAFLYDLPDERVEEIYGDRIRRAPGVVMAPRKKRVVSRKTSACEGDNLPVDGAPRVNSRPYRPRGAGGVGDSLKRRFSADQVAWCAKEAVVSLRQFGYDPESQDFPPAVSSDLLELQHLQRRQEDDINVTGLALSVGERGSSADSSGGPVSCRRDGSTGRPIENGGGSEEASKPASAGDTVMVNNMRIDSAIRVRSKKDAFGRALTPFRRSHTARDTKPLPRKGEDSKAADWVRGRRRAAIVGASEAKTSNAA